MTDPEVEGHGSLPNTNEITSEDEPEVEGHWGGFNTNETVVEDGDAES